MSQLQSQITRLRATEPLPPEFYAAHAVAAAVTAAVAGGGDVPVIFDGMLNTLKQMFDRNPSWGPLRVAHPGDIFRCLAYQLDIPKPHQM